MRKLILIAAAILSVAACGIPEATPDPKSQQAAHGAMMADAVIQHSGGVNSEQDNIAKRLRLTMNPGQIGFVALFNQAGAPIAYYGVKGKITSSGKRLTAPDQLRVLENSNGWTNSVVTAPADEGAYGSSDPYVYFWTTDGQYVQWNGPYLYSDKPFRLRTEPLVISVASSQT